ncbi:OVOS protein, partial [Semnornis frantzii]|nr:OVOS protein [Semnornis frantzii]
QDTVVALQALAHYGYLTFSRKSLNTVKVNFAGSSSKTFQVNDENRFLLQQASLPTIPGDYSVEVNGTGCVYLQVSKLESQHCPSENKQEVLETSFLSIPHATKAPKSLTISHLLYTGNRKISNMAIIDVKMLSGFVPIRSSLAKVKNGRKVNDKSQKHEKLIQII